MPRLLQAACIAVLVLLAACEPVAPPTIAPTLTLIPPTITPTPTDVPPTPTLPSLPAPADLSEAEAPPTEDLLVPAALQSLVAEAVTALTADGDVTIDDVRLVEIEAAVWRTVDLGCGDDYLPGAGEINIEGFRLVFEVGGLDGERVAFHTDGVERIRRCTRADLVRGETEELLQTDPVASELVILAQRRFARDADLAEDAEVEVVEVVAYTWPTTALGCPAPGVFYDPLPVDGYRIVLAAGDATALFHTDFTEVRPCDPANEVLPG